MPRVDVRNEIVPVLEGRQLLLGDLEATTAPRFIDAAVRRYEQRGLARGLAESLANVGRAVLVAPEPRGFDGSRMRSTGVRSTGTTPNN